MAERTVVMCQRTGLPCPPHCPRGDFLRRLAERNLPDILIRSSMELPPEYIADALATGQPFISHYLHVQIEGIRVHSVPPETNCVMQE